MDEIIGLICILFMIVLTCCCLSCCWNVKSKSPIHRHSRTPAQSYHQHHGAGDANEFLLKHSSLNEMSCNMKRFSKISRNDSTTDSALNQRPLSMNNFENVRLVGIVAEENGELYSLSAADPQQRPLDQKDFQRELLLQTLKKANPPIVTVTPQVTCNTVCSSSSSSHSGLKGKIQNGKFQMPVFFFVTASDSDSILFPLNHSAPRSHFACHHFTNMRRESLCLLSSCFPLKEGSCLCLLLSFKCTSCK
jgi:hypothetical protein